MKISATTSQQPHLPHRACGRRNTRVMSRRSGNRVERSGLRDKAPREPGRKIRRSGKPGRKITGALMMIRDWQAGAARLARRGSARLRRRGPAGAPAPSGPVPADAGLGRPGAWIQCPRAMSTHMTTNSNLCAAQFGGASPGYKNQLATATIRVARASVCRRRCILTMPASGFLPLTLSNCEITSRGRRCVAIRMVPQTANIAGE